MSLPGNGIFVVKGEISILMTALRRGSRWSSHSQDEEDGLFKTFQELKEVLNKVDDLRLIEPYVYLSPFLSVVKSEAISGPVTSLALSAVNKFLSYGLIDSTHKSIRTIVRDIADAVTHTKFVGTDQSSDGVVLMKILQVLKTLTLSPEGSTLTNESLCEIMLSCFRICFETRLNELLRRTAEHYLKDMVQLVFVRLPQFTDDIQSNVEHFKMKAGVIEPTKPKRKSKSFRNKIKHDAVKVEKSNDIVEDSSKTQSNKDTHLATPPASLGGNIVDMQGSISQSAQQSDNGGQQTDNAPPQPQSCENGDDISTSVSVDSDLLNTGVQEEDKKDLSQLEDSMQSTDSRGQDKDEDLAQDSLDTYSATSTIYVENSKNETISLESPQIEKQDYVNQRGIRFTAQKQEEIVLLPYGLACVRELFRFLISLCNPLDKQNTDIMIHLGLTLLTVAFEVGADSIGKHEALLALVKDDLCRNLFSLITTERISVFASDLQVSFLMFESLRAHLKFQLENYLIKLTDIINSESVKVTYEHKELALDNILQLWRIPGFVTELYLNYDCDMYCSNLYEDLTKLLAKNAFSTTSGVSYTQILSLDALLTVIESIEGHCYGDDRLDSKLNESNSTLSCDAENVESFNDFVGKATRVKDSKEVPTKEELLARKAIKKWLPTGTDHFNQKPKKGIQFLQEHDVLKPEFDAHEVAMFLRENPALNKVMIGEYISNRNNAHILDAFVKTFEFTDMRIDEALRHYLETFRLPGEAALISLIMEHFAEHWHKSNGEPFEDVDSAFTLAYAIIMLNVDQHNQNAKKQTLPMSASAFKKNLQGVNGGKDFEEDMLDEIYNSIKGDEIVMPAEQSGIVRDNYLWKVLLRKGTSKDGLYHHISGRIYDAQLFELIFGPAVAALSSVFDKSEELNIYKHAIQGFERCAFIASHYSMCASLDMLVLTLCKFTTFHNYQRKPNGTVQFGCNGKAQLALKSVFSLCHQHGDNIRDGWKNIFDLILSLYSHNLLPKNYIEVEDFIQSSGKITLTYQEVENQQKQDTGLFSSLYSYMVSSENLSKIPTAEEQDYIDLANKCIKECNLDQLVTDSKFLHEEALQQLVKALVELSNGPDVHKSLGYNYNENITVFFLELLVRIVIQNRDRVMKIWQAVRDHLYTLVMNACLFDYQFLLERSVIGLLRIAIRLMRNEEMSPVVLQSLRMLLLLKSSTLCRISRQISFGLYELLKTSAQNIHTNTDWTIIFTLLECVGAGAQPPKPIVDDNQMDSGTKSDGEASITADDDISTDRGYTSDSELTKSPRHVSTRSQSPVILQTSPVGSPTNTGGWILVGNEGEIQPVVGRTVPPSQYNLALERNLGPHDPSSLIKCCESLAFLVRDVAHITPYNFDDCVHCIRTFVEASLHGNNRNRKNSKKDSHTHRKANRRKQEIYNSRRSPTSSIDSEDDSDDDSLPSGYHQISIQLLDLMHTLHTRTAQIFRWWAEEGGEISQDTSLWTQGWCPLLQGIARLCCDIRRQVRMSAITYLQRALLVHDLQTLTGPEWEACFHRVLFPLLGYLLQPINPKDPVSMEETRMRAATVLSKVFLHHLTPLLSLPTFSSLWMIILDFMDKYMNADKSDLLYEAIPESLKNMLLVMDSAGVFGASDSRSHLWITTWDRINKFLPDMKDELFKEVTEEPAIPENLQETVNNIGSKPVQYNIENATRSSIILQPPSTQQPVSSQLFAHLGQMVSTPIGPTICKEPNYPLPPIPQSAQHPSPRHYPSFSLPQVPVPLPLVSNSPLPLPQSPGVNVPYMSNLFAGPPPPNQPHTFPVLYNNPVIPSTRTTEVQPVSLYTEYLENPYNTAQPGDKVLEKIPVPYETTQPPAYASRFYTESTNEVGGGTSASASAHPRFSPQDVNRCSEPSQNSDNQIANAATDTETNTVSFDVNKNDNSEDCSHQQQQQTFFVGNSGSQNNNGVQISSTASFFQSSNYFYTDSGHSFIPPGSEILFGKDNINNIQATNNIPVCTNAKTSDV